MKQKINKYKVGLDFDNTIICYDDVFHTIALKKGWIKKDFPHSKVLVKEFLVKEDHNDLRWQELQAEAYGEEIFTAHFYPEALQVIKTLKDLGHELHIVSHKSEYSHLRKEVNLRQKALEWMEQNKLLEIIPPSNVHFAADRNQKVEKIKNLGIDFFLDDLLEVLEHPQFPSSTLRFHFTPGLDVKTKVEFPQINHWTKFQEAFEHATLIGAEAYQAFVEHFKTSPKTITSLKRDGNNRIFKMATDNEEIILKSYLKINENERNRGQVEFHALQAMWKNKMTSIPVPLKSHEQYKFCFYQFISGKALQAPTESMMIFLGDFLGDLYKLGTENNLEQFSEGADSRKSLQDYLAMIDKRLKEIEKGRTEPLMAPVFKLLDEEIYPLKEIVVGRFMKKINQLEISLSTPLPKAEKTLSPSDYGLHNMLESGPDKWIIFDFEYFGWDDPCKMIADFYHHAGQNFSIEFKHIVKDRFLQHYPFPDQFNLRFSLVSELIGLEWILIILNIASPAVLERKKFANPSLDVGNYVTERVIKAQEKLKQFEV